MRTQIIQDHNGLPTGVFIPIEDWENIKKSYPNIEKVDDDIPQWQKDIVLERVSQPKGFIDAFEMLDKVKAKK